MKLTYGCLFTKKNTMKLKTPARPSETTNEIKNEIVILTLLLL